MARTAGTRGDSTRAALLRAALEIFGRDGFHAASTRAIARAAGVNQALIGFHFGGKQGLYQATLEHVLGRIGERMGPLLARVTADLGAAGSEPRAAAARLRRHLPHVYLITDGLVAMLTAEESRAWARLILREQQDPGAAFAANYERSIGAVLSLLTDLVARILGRDAGDRRVRLLVLTIVGQALVFRAAAAAAHRHLRRARFGRRDVAAIQALIRENVRAMLAAAVAP